MSSPYFQFCLDHPEQAAAQLEQLRTIQGELVSALQAYVDEARSHVCQGKPGSPFAQRLAAAEVVLAKVQK
jgi:hypothetical protein